MKLYDWGDFSGDSGVEDTPLLISVRSQSLILSALEKLQPRWAWVEVDDGDWDDIDGAIAQAIKEVTKIAMNDASPVGSIVAWAGTIATIPDKWQICDGHLLDVDDYPDLRAALDIPFDDNTFLTVPDLRDRFVYGMGTGSTLGATGGAETVALAVNELPAHSHNVLRQGAAGGATTALVITTTSQVPNPATQIIAGGALSVGSGAAHQNLPPYIRLYYIMKVLP